MDDLELGLGPRENTTSGDVWATEQATFRFLTNKEARENAMMNFNLELAKGIRSVRIGVKCMVPIRFLSEAFEDSDEESSISNQEGILENVQWDVTQHFDLDLQGTVIQDERPQWISDFKKDLYKVMDACRDTLEVLEIQAIWDNDHDDSDDHTNQLEAKKINIAFCNTIVECLSSFDFPQLSRVALDTQDPGNFSRLWELSELKHEVLKIISPSRSLAASALLTNIERWEDISLTNSISRLIYRRPNKEAIRQFLKFTSNLKNLRSLRLNLRFTPDPSKLPIAYITRSKQLTKLSIANTHISGNLSEALSRCKSLKSLGMDELAIKWKMKGQNWGDVFNVCMGLAKLEYIKINALSYTDLQTWCFEGHNCFTHTECQEEDRIAARELLKVMDAKYKEGKAFPCDWVVCSDVKVYQYTVRGTLLLRLEISNEGLRTS